MSMNPLPPQAYTKETLLKAYQWLTGQNASIKEMATSPDILVSLYLKATRDGDSALERPSIQNFKNELKNLAGMMGELDRPQAFTPHQAMPSLVAASPTPAPAAPMATPASTKVTQQTPVQAPASGPLLSGMSTLFEALDGVSRAMIQEVKAEFNLSSEIEALRMLVKLGHKQAQKII